MTPRQQKRFEEIKAGANGKVAIADLSHGSVKQAGRVVICTLEPTHLPFNHRACAAW